jgi:hypothetical protein
MGGVWVDTKRKNNSTMTGAGFHSAIMVGGAEGYLLNTEVGSPDSEVARLRWPVRGMQRRV